ncbi:hypothetical protein predicted by Glimmer/Critica [Acetobacter ghanensis]|uniref:Uncharacterized protein n=1 Tax=Acetobacter ghanensis TaxID=431306 RepID=A0A0U5F1F6_9PROT|nr:hypothetical protein AA18895_0630 [Acetobacter ghanensis DSM 18895]CEF54844.1 hypothetical protein predicted by Glimmer/Critica [Acetobacter ghanensis]
MQKPVARQHRSAGKGLRQAPPARQQPVAPQTQTEGAPARQLPVPVYLYAICSQWASDLNYGIALFDLTGRAIKAQTGRQFGKVPVCV